MSSVVNKSSTRFAPKATQRGAVRKQPRRMSVTSTSAPGSAPLTRAPSTVVETIPEAVAELRKEVNFGVTQRTSSSRDETAIDDDDRDPLVVAAPSEEPAVARGKRRSVPIDLAPAAAVPVPTQAGQGPSRMLPTPDRLSSLSSARRSTAGMNPLLPRLPRAGSTAAAATSTGTVTDVYTAPVGARGPQARQEPRDPNVMTPSDIPRTRKGRRALVVPDGEKRVIEEDTFTMADLCKDIPIGKINDDYWHFEEARKKRKIQRERILYEKRVWKSVMNDPNQPEAVRAAAKDEWLKLQKFDKERRGHMEVARREQDERAREEELRKAAVAAQDSGPKMRLNPDGTIALDDSSQFVELPRPDHDNDTREREEVNKYDSFTNSASYTNRERGERWDDAETQAFYEAVSLWGTDFNLISHMFPGRTRRQIKTKFKHEEKHRPELMAMAILRKVPVKVDRYSEQTGKEMFSHRVLKKDITQVRERHEKHLVEAEAARERAIREDRERDQAEDVRKFGREVKPIDADVEVVGSLDDVKREVR